MDEPLPFHPRRGRGDVEQLPAIENRFFVRTFLDLSCSIRGSSKRCRSRRRNRSACHPEKSKQGFLLNLSQTRGQFHQPSMSSFYARKSQKKTVKLSSFFALLGFAHIKAAHKMLVKLTPAVAKNKDTSIWRNYVLPCYHQICLHLYVSLSVSVIILS